MWYFTGDRWDKCRASEMCSKYKLAYLSILLTLCVRFGLVPNTFLTGVLVPIVKNLTFIHVMQQVISLSIFL